MTLTERTQRSRSDETRQALIDAGLVLFGHKGFEATSTRELAARAGTNAASIAYHFGNKDGLRKACALWIAEQIGAIMKPALAGEGPPLDQVSAEERIAQAIQTMAGVMLSKDNADFSPFLMREITWRGEVFEIMYDEMFLPLHAHVCKLWAAATGHSDPESEQVRLEVFAAVGQLAYFRISQVSVLTRMGWTDIGPQQIARIAALCAKNVRAQIGVARARNSEELTNQAKAV